MSVPIDSTLLASGKRRKDLKQIEKALDTGSVDHLTTGEQRELKRLLAEKGLTLDLILERYKAIVNSKGFKVTGSHVLKALENLTTLHGVATPQSETETKIRAVFQSKSAEEVKSYVMEVTQKTKFYMDKLEEADNQADSE